MPPFLEASLPFMLTKLLSTTSTCAGLFCFKMDAQGSQQRLQSTQPHLQNNGTSVPHTCEVLQRRALHPEAQHLLHRQVNRIIPARCHVSAAAATSARVRTPF